VRATMSVLQWPYPTKSYVMLWDTKRKACGHESPQAQFSTSIDLRRLLYAQRRLKKPRVANPMNTKTVPAGSGITAAGDKMYALPPTPPSNKLTTLRSQFFASVSNQIIDEF